MGRGEPGRPVCSTLEGDLAFPSPVLPQGKGAVPPPDALGMSAQNAFFPGACRGLPQLLSAETSLRCWPESLSAPLGWAAASAGSLCAQAERRTGAAEEEVDERGAFSW